MDRFKWENANGRTILYQDFSKAKKEELIPLLEMSHKQISGKGSRDIIVVTNIESVTFDRHTTKAFEELSQKNKVYVKASALYGVGTWQKIAIDAVGKLTGRAFNIFKDEKEVSQWIDEI